MLARQQEGAIGVGTSLDIPPNVDERTEVEESRGGRDAPRTPQAVSRLALATMRMDLKSKPIKKAEFFTNLTRGQQWQDAKLAGVFKALENASFDPESCP